MPPDTGDIHLTLVQHVPLVIHVRETSNAGRPAVATDPGSHHGKPYFAIAEMIWAAIGKAKAAAKP